MCIHKDQWALAHTKLKAHWGEIAYLSQGVEYQPSELAMWFLIGLNDSYDNIRMQILMIDPLPPLSEIFNLIVQAKR